MKSLPHLTDTAKPTDVNNDWLAQFSEFCRNVSDGDLQTVWSRILAGEFNSPGSFSRRTLRMVADFDRSDAELFTALCRFTVFKESPFPLIYDTSAPIYTSALTYPHLVHLENIGLIRISDSAGGFTLSDHTNEITLRYFDTLLHLTLPGTSSPTRNDFPLGRVVFSGVGVELLQIAGATELEGFANYLCGVWASRRIQSVRQNIIEGKTETGISESTHPA